MPWRAMRWYQRMNAYERAATRMQARVGGSLLAAMVAGMLIAGLAHRHRKQTAQLVMTPEQRALIEQEKDIRRLRYYKAWRRREVLSDLLPASELECGELPLELRDLGMEMWLFPPAARNGAWTPLNGVTASVPVLSGSCAACSE